MGLGQAFARRGRGVSGFFFLRFVTSASVTSVLVWTDLMNELEGFEFFVLRGFRKIECLCSSAK